MGFYFDRHPDADVDATLAAMERVIEYAAAELARYFMPQSSGRTFL
jgi:hypothetical protein